MRRLAEFRSALSAILPNEYCRPFVCDGSPLDCKSFVVGLNAATRLERSFFDYWSDDSGFNRKSFCDDYIVARGSRGLRGNRRRIEIMSNELGLSVLETNIYATPTKKAADLKNSDRDDRCFMFLLRTIRPKLVVAHSNEPIRLLQRFVISGESCEKSPVRAEVDGEEFWLYGVPGPLYRKSFDEIKEIASRLRGFCAV